MEWLMGFPIPGRPLLNPMKAPDGLFHLRLYPLCLISMSIIKDTRFSNVFIFLSHITLSSNRPLIWTGSYLGTLTLSPAMAKSSMHPSNIIGIMRSTTTIAPFSAKTQNTRTYIAHRGCWKQQKLKMSLTSYMPYLQEALVDECIEELERKEKWSKDFRNSLDFLKNSPFHSLVPFPGQSPNRYTRDIGSFDNFLLFNGDTPFFTLPYHSHNDRDICVQVGLITNTFIGNPHYFVRLGFETFESKANLPMNNHRGYTQPLKMKPLCRKNIRIKRPLRKQQNSLATTQGSGTNRTQGSGQSGQGSTSLIQYLFEMFFIDDFYTSDLLISL